VERKLVYNFYIYLTSFSTSYNFFFHYKRNPPFFSSDLISMGSQTPGIDAFFESYFQTHEDDRQHLGYPSQITITCNLSHKPWHCCQQCFWQLCQICGKDEALCLICGAEPGKCTSSCKFTKTGRHRLTGWKGKCNGCKDDKTELGKLPDEILKIIDQSTGGSAQGGASAPAHTVILIGSPSPPPSVKGASSKKSRSPSPAKAVKVSRQSASPVRQMVSRSPSPSAGGASKRSPSPPQRQVSPSPVASPKTKKSRSPSPKKTGVLKLFRFWSPSMGRGRASRSPTPAGGASQRRRSPSPSSSSGSLSPASKEALVKLRVSLADAISQKSGAAASTSSIVRDPPTPTAPEMPKPYPEHWEFESGDDTFDWKEVFIFRKDEPIEDRYLSEVQKVFAEALKSAEAVRTRDRYPNGYSALDPNWTVQAISRCQNRKTYSAFKLAEQLLTEQYRGQDVKISTTGYHGTTQLTSAKSISRDGVCARLTQKDAYGWGMYLSLDNLSPAQQHAFLHGNSEGFILMCRVIVGKAERTYRGSHHNSAGFDSGTCATNLICVVFKETHVYPEYIMHIKIDNTSSDAFMAQANEILALKPKEPTPPADDDDDDDDESKGSSATVAPKKRGGRRRRGLRFTDRSKRAKLAKQTAASGAGGAQASSPGAGGAQASTPGAGGSQASASAAYSATSPSYVPVTPSYSPTSPSYVPVTPSYLPVGTPPAGGSAAVIPPSAAAVSPTPGGASSSQLPSAGSSSGSSSDSDNVKKDPTYKP
jgi:hypothetical protein